jgi:hypothetical protein
MKLQLLLLVGERSKQSPPAPIKRNPRKVAKRAVVWRVRILCSQRSSLGRKSWPGNVLSESTLPLPLDRWRSSRRTRPLEECLLLPKLKYSGHNARVDCSACKLKHKFNIRGAVAMQYGIHRITKEQLRSIIFYDGRVVTRAALDIVAYLPSL